MLMVACVVVDVVVRDVDCSACAAGIADSELTSGGQRRSLRGNRLGRRGMKVSSRGLGCGYRRPHGSGRLDGKSASVAVVDRPPVQRLEQ